jgi:superfamily I DNA/RNA helicase
MENKTTTELLDLLNKIEKKADNSKDGDKDWDTFGDVFSELRKREPFKRIIGEKDYDNDEPSLEEKVEKLEEEIKLLKRHKHDGNNGDVLIRI